MSILIKGMEMPKNCDVCFMRDVCEYSMPLEKRLTDCPLIEIPPHGRLIDADVLKRNITANLPVAVQDLCPGFCNIVDMQKTVIESEGN